MDASPLADQVKRQLRAIQKKRNFNPHWGAKQLQGCADPAVHRDYGAFKVLVGLAKVCSVTVPYGDSDTAPDPPVEAGPSYVYFGRLENTSTWKIGFSKEPLQRRKSLQTGNQERIDVYYRIPGGFDLEQAVLRYTANYKTRGRGGTEWRDGLTVGVIKRIIRRVKTEGPGFLEGPRLQRNRDGNAQVRPEQAHG